MKCIPRASLFPALILAAALSKGALAQNVLVVDDDPGPGVDHTSLADALAAAVHGEILLIRSGIYELSVSPPTTVTGKALTLIGEDPIDISGSLEIRNVPAGTTFAVRNLDGNDMDFAVNGVDNPGRIWIEACGLGTADGGPFVTDSVNFDSTSAILQRCSLIGARAEFNGALMTAFGTSFQGYNFGEPGALLNDSFGFASGSSFEGAHPGFDLHLTGSSSAILFDSVADFTSAGVSLTRGVARGFSADGTVTEGGTLNLQVTGVPGDLAFALVSLGTSSLYVPSLNGALTVGAISFAPVFLGAVGASGSLQASAPVPMLPAPVEGRVYYAQLLVLSGSGQPLLGGGSMIAILDGGL